MLVIVLLVLSRALIQSVLNVVIPMNIICERILKTQSSVTFYNSNICNQNKEWQLSINLKVVTICCLCFYLPEYNVKHLENFVTRLLMPQLCNSVYFNVTLRLIFRNRVTYIGSIICISVLDRFYDRKSNR